MLRSCRDINKLLKSARFDSDLQIAVRGRTSTSFPYWARALGLVGENFRSARAQNLKLELVFVLILQIGVHYLKVANGRIRGDGSWVDSKKGKTLHVFLLLQNTEYWILSCFRN